MKGRYISAGRATCSVCGRVYSVNASGVIRKHWQDGDGTPRCSGSDEPSVPTPAAPVFVRAPDVLRGRLPLSGDRSFTYEAPHPLTVDDVRRIASTLLLHVDGVAGKAWSEAVVAGLVPDLEKMR